MSEVEETFVAKWDLAIISAVETNIIRLFFDQMTKRLGTLCKYDFFSYSHINTRFLQIENITLLLETLLSTYPAYTYESDITLIPQTWTHTSTCGIRPTPKRPSSTAVLHCSQHGSKYICQPEAYWV